MISDLLDESCQNERDVCVILSSYVMMPTMLEDRDKVAEELDSMIEHIYHEEFEDLYNEYILPFKAEVSNEENSEEDNELSDQDPQEDDEPIQEDE